MKRLWLAGPAAALLLAACGPRPDLLVAASELDAHCGTELAALSSELKKLEQKNKTASSVEYLRQMDALLMRADNLSGNAQLYEYTHPDEPARKEGGACARHVYQFFNEVAASRPLYENLAALTPPEDAGVRRYLEENLRDFRRNGIDRSAEERGHIKDLREQIQKLGQEFALNIRQARATLRVKSERLKGLPGDYLAKHPPDAEGFMEISTDYPDYFPVMNYAEDDGLRRELASVFLSRAWPQNDDVLMRILRLRHEMARALGHANFAEYHSEDKMIKNAESIDSFINYVHTLGRPGAQRDMEVLLAELRQTMPEAQNVENWQKSWLITQVKKKRHGADPREVREYFSYGKVKRGILELTEDLFGVRIKPWKTRVWHDSIEAYELYDGKKLLGRFYLDMHPREGKYSHAAHFGIQSGLDGKQLPLSALVCNFPAEGKIEHKQVETFLHEFGHLLHHIFGGHQKWLGFSGIATERDFVEAPSQMLEEWVWDYETLAKFATNDRGEVIPRELVEKMRGARGFARSLWMRNQMFYAALSLHYHQEDPEKLNLLSDMILLQLRYSDYPYIPGTAFYASFGHLYGYSAGYYTYMWSLAIAADMFGEFKRNGLRDKKTAARYRRAVLEPGGSKNAENLVRDFLGRPYNFDAFIDSFNQSL